MHFLGYNRKIQNLSLVCAIFVVSIHLPIPQCQNDFSYACWSVMQCVASIAVPFFFVFSGYFLSAHFDEVGWWGREVRKRIRTVLLPYVLWSCIVLLNREVTCILRSTLLGVQPDYTVDIIKWFGFDLTCKPGAYPLWFLRNLMLLVITSVFVKKYVDLFQWFGVILLYILCLCFGRCMFFDNGYSLVGLLYFSAGIACRRAKPVKIGKALTIISILISVIFLCMVGRFGFEYMKGVLQVGIPFMMVACWYLISERAWNGVLVSCAFPIYVMHIIVQPHVYSIIKYFHLPYLLGFVSQWTLCVGIPVVITLLCRRFAPKGAVLLFGGR